MVGNKNIWAKDDGTEEEIKSPVGNSVINETSIEKGGYEELNVIDINNISLSFNDGSKQNVIFDNFSLEIKDIVETGQFVTIMGKSGCGKSTLLRYISGIQPVNIHNSDIDSSGEILIYGQQPTKKLPMVFQQYTSIEWMSVLKNVALPLIFSGVPEEEAFEKARQMLKIVGLEGHEKKWAKYPILSGGQLQRIAIARSLVMNPQILLMDEPFGALDIVTRQQMQLFMRSLFEQENKLDPTVILVTHSISEAVFLSSDVIILDSGPASVQHHVKIDLPKVRDNSIRRLPEFREYVNNITDMMEEIETRVK